MNVLGHIQPWAAGSPERHGKWRDEKRQPRADVVSDLYLYIEISPLQARMQTMRLSSGCSKLGLYHLDQDRAKLLSDEFVA